MIWLPVVGWEDRYLVSDIGFVWSRRRWVPGKGGCLREYEPGLLCPHAQEDGRLVVHLRKDKERAVRRVHVLVLEAFVGPRPPGAVGRHLNDVNTDNRLENLAWGSYKDNAQDALRNGRNAQVSKTHCPRGHEYTEENTTVCTRADGATFRQCKVCRRERYAERKGV